MWKETPLKLFHIIPLVSHGNCYQQSCNVNGVFSLFHIRLIGKCFVQSYLPRVFTYLHIHNVLCESLMGVTDAFN